MSVQATTWVWEHSKAEGNALLVLLAIADAANREGGESCQAVSTVARMARISRATAYRQITALKDLGEIEKVGISGRYKTNIYRMPGVARGLTDETSQIATPVTGETPGVSPVRPDPSTTNPSTSSVPTTEVSVEQRPSRPTLIPKDWWPAPTTLTLAKQRYPDVNHDGIAERLVYWATANAKTSRSWGADFLSWCSRDQEKHDAEQRSGTDDLGVPRTQRRSSAVSEGAQPGDPDYFDPIAYLEEHPHE